MRNVLKILVFLGLILIVQPQSSFAAWDLSFNFGGRPIHHEDRQYYAYQEHPRLIVEPPIGSYVPAIPPDYRIVIINGRTYYRVHRVYYILTPRHGYKVVQPPVVWVRR